MSPRCRNCAPVPQELRTAAGLLERRWTMATIYACSSGAVRFNEFRQSLPGVSPTTLSERLEQLEAAGVVKRPLVPRRPPPTEDTPTARGARPAQAGARPLRPRGGGPPPGERPRPPAPHGVHADRAGDAPSRGGRRTAAALRAAPPAGQARP